MDHRYIHLSLRRFRESFVVLAQPTEPAQPRQRSLDHPSSWQHLELMAVPRAPHNLQDVASVGLNPINQPPSVTSISPDEPQPRKPAHQSVDNQHRPIPILHVGRMDYDGQQQPYGIDDDVSLASCDFLTSIIATRPPFSVVLTDWLSMIAALGVHSLPSACLTFGRSASWTCSHVPSFFHLRKYWYTVCQGGRSWGMDRHAHPLRRTYKIPFTTSCRSTVRGLPPGLAAGSNGASIFHWSFVRSLG